MNLDKLISRLQRLGFRTQRIGAEIALKFQGRSTARGTKAQIEKLLPLLAKEATQTGHSSTWSLEEHPEYKPPAQRDRERSGAATTKVAMAQSPSGSQTEKQSEQPYQELLKRLRQLESEHGRYKILDRGKKRKKKRKRRKKRKGWIVSGGLPSLGKRR